MKQQIGIRKVSLFFFLFFFCLSFMSAPAAKMNCQAYATAFKNIVLAKNKQGLINYLAPEVEVFYGGASDPFAFFQKKEIAEAINKGEISSLVSALSFEELAKFFQGNVSVKKGTRKSLKENAKKAEPVCSLVQEKHKYTDVMGGEYEGYLGFHLIVSKGQWLIWAVDEANPEEEP